MPKDIKLSQKDWAKFYPQCAEKKAPDCTKLRMTDTALYSTTPADHMDYTLEQLYRYIPKSKLKNMTATDVGACIGGNTFGLAMACKKVYAVELFTIHAEILEHNRKILYPKLTNIEVLNENYLSLIDTLKQDVIFMDPPWGGPEYRSFQSVELYYSSQAGKVHIHELIPILKNKAKVIIVKVPRNYNKNLRGLGFPFVEVVPIEKEKGIMYKLIILSHSKPSTYKYKKKIFPPVGYRNIQLNFEKV